MARASGVKAVTLGIGLLVIEARNLPAPELP